MGNLHLVTGFGGAAHITAKDHGSFNAAIFGSDHYILSRGKRLAAQVISNNQIRILDGDLVAQGRHIRLDAGTYVDLTIDNGSQGYNRNDLIVVRYSKNTSTGVEDCNLVVVKGTATTGTATDPTCTTGDLLTGTATTHDVPLYRVPISGITVGTPVLLRSVVGSMANHDHNDSYYTKAQVDDKLEENTGKMADYVTEEGKTNGWSYRVWKSGKKECWKKGEISTSCRSAIGTAHRSPTHSVVMPFSFSSIEHYALSGSPPTAYASVIAFWRLVSFGDSSDRVNMEVVSLSGEESQVKMGYSVHVVGQ